MIIVNSFNKIFVHLFNFNSVSKKEGIKLNYQNEHQCKLDSKRWSNLNPKTFFINYFENRKIENIKRKLNEYPITNKSLLNVDETILSLQIMLDYYEEKNLSKKATEFISDFIKWKYIPRDLNNIKITILNNYLEELKRLKNPNNKPSNTLNEFQFLQQLGISPTLLMTKLVDPLPEYSSFQLKCLESFMNNCPLSLKSELKIPSPLILPEAIVFEEFAKVISNPALSQHYVDLYQFPDSVPLQVDEQIMSKSFLCNNIKDHHEFITYLDSLSKQIKKAKGIKNLIKELENGNINFTSAIPLFNIYSIFKNINFNNFNSNDLKTKEAKELHELIIKLNLRYPALPTSQTSFFDDTGIDFSSDLIQTLGINNLTEYFEIFNSSKINLLRDANKFFVHQKTLMKLENILKKEDLVKLSEEDRLSAREFHKIKKLKKHSKKLDDIKTFFKNCDPNHIIFRSNKLINNFFDLTQRKEEKDFIHVCFKMPFKHVDQRDCEKTNSIWKRLALVVEHIYNPAIHSNFLWHAKNENFFGIIGQGDRGYYSRQVSGRYSPIIEEYEIKVKKLIPKHILVNHADFKGEFFKNLKEIILQPHFSTCPTGENLWKRIFFRFSLQKIFPADIEIVNQHYGKDLLCSQYVSEAIIKAHVATCDTFEISPPQSLAFYGFYDDQSLESLIPDRVKSALVHKGILKPLKKPAWAQ